LSGVDQLAERKVKQNKNKQKDEQKNKKNLNYFFYRIDFIRM